MARAKGSMVFTRLANGAWANSRTRGWIKWCRTKKVTIFLNLLYLLFGEWSWNVRSCWLIDTTIKFFAGLLVCGFAVKFPTFVLCMAQAVTVSYQGPLFWRWPWVGILWDTMTEDSGVAGDCDNIREHNFTSKFFTANFCKSFIRWWERVPCNQLPTDIIQIVVEAYQKFETLSFSRLNLNFRLQSVHIFISSRKRSNSCHNPANQRSIVWQSWSPVSFPSTWTEFQTLKRYFRGRFWAESQTSFTVLNHM